MLSTDFELPPRARQFLIFSTGRHILSPLSLGKLSTQLPGLVGQPRKSWQPRHRRTLSKSSSVSGKMLLHSYLLEGSVYFLKYTY